MPDENAAPAPNPQPINPGPTPTGYQRTQGGSFKWVPPSAEELNKLLPQYEIEALVGRGGMGAVYRGKQKRLDRPVAIKILPPEVDAEDDSYTTRFQNEAKIMAKLEHPAIVPVYDFGETSTGLLYFVMSFIDGTDVHQMIQRQGRLPPEHALAITAHVCDALRYAHEHGVIHRDIKPSNVLINMDGQVKVADFGLAKMDDPSQSSGITKTGLAMGTPDYVAPETLTLGMTVDGRADLYAVGVMLYQMLTGNVPRGAFKPASVMIPGIDPRFDAIATKAMQHDRDERYQSAAEIRRDLDAILTAPLVQAGGPSSAAIPKAAVAQKPVAKGPQKPMGKSANVPVDGRRVRQNAEDAAGTPDRTLASAPTAKSKTPLLIGLGAVAAIAVGAFVMMGGEGRRVRQNAESATTGGTLASSPTGSSTPIKVREPAKPEPKPAAASKTPEPAKTAPGMPAAPASKKEEAVTVANPPPRPKAMPTPVEWSDFTEAVANFTPNSVRKLTTGFEVIEPIFSNVNRTEVADSMLRVRHRGGVGLQLRYQSNHAVYAAIFRDSSVILKADKAGGSSFAGKTIQSFSFPSRFDTKAEHESVFIAQGDELSAWVDGQFIGSVKDATLSTGYTRLSADAGTTILQVEHGILPSTGANAVASGPVPARLPDPAKWVKVFETPESVSPHGITKDGFIHLRGDLKLATAPTLDCAVRAKLKFEAGATSVIELNLRNGSNSNLKVGVQDGKKLRLTQKKDTQFSTFANIPINASSGSTPVENLIEFVLVGKVAQVSLDGQVVIRHVFSDEIPAGGISISSADGLVRDIAWQSLDPANPADEKLAALEREYQERLQKEADGPFATAVAELAAKLKAALERSAATVRGSPAEAAMRTEIARIDKKEPIPPADEKGIPAALATLRKTWHTELAKLLATRTQNATPAKTACDQALAALQKELESTGDINRAEKIKQARVQLANAPSDLSRLAHVVAGAPQKMSLNTRPTKAGKLRMIGCVGHAGMPVDATPFAGHSDYVQVMVEHGVAALRANGSAIFQSRQDAALHTFVHEKPPLARLTHVYAASAYGLTEDGTPVVIGSASNAPLSGSGYIDLTGIDGFWAALKADGTIVFFVRDLAASAWLPKPDTLPKAKAIKATKDGFMLLTADGSVRSWFEKAGEVKVPLDLRRNVAQWRHPKTIFSTSTNEVGFLGLYLKENGDLIQLNIDKTVKLADQVVEMGGYPPNYHWQPKRRPWVINGTDGFYGELAKLREVLAKSTPISWDNLSGSSTNNTATGIFAWIE